MKFSVADKTKFMPPNSKTANFCQKVAKDPGKTMSFEERNEVFVFSVLFTHELALIVFFCRNSIQEGIFTVWTSRVWKK